jgi:hypothetical protein
VPPTQRCAPFHLLHCFNQLLSSSLQVFHVSSKVPYVAGVQPQGKSLITVCCLSERWPRLLCRGPPRDALVVARGPRLAEAAGSMAGLSSTTATGK